MFIFSDRNFHSIRILYEKPAPKTGARRWSRFRAPVSRACGMGISNCYVVKLSEYKSHVYLCSWIHLQCIQVDRYRWSYLECLYRWLWNYNLRCLLHIRRYLHHHRSRYEVTSIRFDRIVAVILLLLFLLISTAIHVQENCNSPG